MAALGEPLLAEPFGVGAVLRRAGPRLVRDGFGPLAAFYAGWKLVGLGAGIAAAAVFGIAVYTHERRSGRPAMIVRVALVLVAIRATVGITSGSATVYLAQEIGIDALLASAVLASLAASRPFARLFAQEIYPLPEPIRESEVFAAAMRRITLVWALYFLARGTARLLALLALSTNSYVLVIALTDAPFLIALLAWSVYHTSRVLRASPEWGPLIAQAQAATIAGDGHRR